MSVSATTKIPVSEITTFHAAEPARGGADTAGTEVHELVIQPSKGWIGVDWWELWRFRELLYFLVWRDVKVRYKQAILGIGWAILDPILNMILFTAIFGVALNMQNKLPPGLPFAVFIFAGLIPWKLFSTGLTQGGMSLVNQQHMLTKIYFPRLFIPTSSVGSALVDMGLQFVVFAALMAYYQYTPAWQTVFVLPLILLAMVMSSGIAYLLSALTITYRDFRFLIPVASQIWMWLSFIQMPTPESIQNSPKWQVLLAANPMYGIVAAFRAAITGETIAVGFRWMYLVSSIVISCGVFVLGLFYFKKTEKRFADIA
jgi:lipopolysaccharide transport system permease protein